MIENIIAIQRRINFMSKYGVIKNEFFSMTEQAFANHNHSYLEMSIQKTVGNEIHCDFKNSKYLVSVRLDLMSVNIYVWIFDHQSNKNGMYSFDNKSKQFLEIEAKRSKRAMENLQERLQMHIQNALTNDEIMNAEPAFEYYLKVGKQENIQMLYEYVENISNQLASNKPLI